MINANFNNKIFQMILVVNKTVYTGAWLRNAKILQCYYTLLYQVGVENTVTLTSNYKNKKNLSLLTEYRFYVANRQLKKENGFDGSCVMVDAAYSKWFNNTMKVID